MDVLWSPWRYDYIKTSAAATSDCVFCDILNNSASDEENFILKRAEFNFVILNIYPYGTGHLLIVPFEHTAVLNEVDKRSSDEMMDLTKRSQALRLHRQGEAPDRIAAALELPRQEVELLLKVHHIVLANV